MFVWVALQFAVGSAIQDVLDDTGDPRPAGPARADPRRHRPHPAHQRRLLRRRGRRWPGVLAQRPPEGPAGRAGEHHPRPERHPAPARRHRRAAAHRPRAARRRRPPRVGHRHPGGGGPPGHRPRPRGGGRRARRHRALLARGGRPDAQPARHAARPRRGDPERDGRAPEPGVRRPAGARRRAHGIRLVTAYDQVESSPGAAQHSRRPLGLSLYRVAQEALANTHQALDRRSARVVLRVEDRDRAALRRGRGARRRAPARRRRPASGLGHLGMRERAAGDARRGRDRAAPDRRLPGAGAGAARGATVPEPGDDRCACSSSTTSISCAPASG